MKTLSQETFEILETLLKIYKIDELKSLKIGMKKMYDANDKYANKYIDLINNQINIISS